MSDRYNFMKTVVVIPTYNEKENIPELIEKILALNIVELEVLFVDDNSPDGTAQLIKSFQLTNPKIHLLERAGKLGIGSAYIAGFKYALSNGADFVFEMDADLSHNPTDIPRLLKAGMDGSDLVIGSRKISGGGVVGWNFKRKLMSNGAMYFSRFILGLKTKDVTAGFRCFRRKVLESIDWDKVKSNGYAFQEEIIYRVERQHFKVTEVPVIFNDRQKGQSKLSQKDIIEFFITMLKLKLKIP